MTGTPRSPSFKSHWPCCILFAIAIFAKSFSSRLFSSEARGPHVTSTTRHGSAAAAMAIRQLSTGPMTPWLTLTLAIVTMTMAMSGGPILERDIGVLTLTRGHMVNRVR